jgi:hypothetical protein
VAYHDSLWVTVGAAAPVIALTAIVSISDAWRGGKESRGAFPALPTPSVRSLMPVA